MKITSRILTLMAAMLLPTGSALALGSITQGDVTFAYTSFAQGNNNTTNADFTGAGTGDQLYESWWFFRVNGDTRETAFAAPNTEDYTTFPAYARLGWTNVSGRSLFDATLNVSVMDPGVGGNLFQEMTITATSNVTMTLFHYADFDVSGSAGGDSASLVSSSPDVNISIGDGVTNVPFIGYGATAFKVRDYNANGGNPSVLRDLTDNGVDNLDNSGLPFAAGDYAGAVSWTLTLLAGQSATFLTQFGTNAPLLPQSAMPTPEPGTAVLMAIGLIGLAIQGNRARRSRRLR